MEAYMEALKRQYELRREYLKGLENGRASVAKEIIALLDSKRISTVADAVKVIRDTFGVEEN